MRKRAMTLLEVLIVVVVVGILATLGLFNYGPLRENRLQKLAAIALKYIQAAEELYLIEFRQFYGPTDTAAAGGTTNINSFLKLSLDNRDWDYAVTVNNAANPPTYSLVATRKAGSQTGCTETLARGANDPTNNCH